jgi:hypothetical protein
MARKENEKGLPKEPDSAGGGEQDPEHDGSDSSLEKPGPREGSGTDEPDSPGGGQN